MNVFVVLVAFSMLAMTWAAANTKMKPFDSNRAINATYLNGLREDTVKVYTKYDWELDTDAMVKKSTFAIPPKELIARAKEVFDRFPLEADDFSEDFAFVFPVVGPLSKGELLKAFRGFGIKESFPDLCPNAYGFHVDPFEHNRVWWRGYGDMTHTGEGVFGKPTGKRVLNPPEVFSYTFNEKGQVTKFTGGYSVDRTMGNTGGLGGVFGIFHSLGKSLPFREAKPWKPSLTYRFFNLVQKVINKFQPKDEV